MKVKGTRKAVLARELRLKFKRRIMLDEATASMRISFRAYCESPLFARPYLDPDKRGTLYTPTGWAIIDASDGNRPDLSDDEARAIFGCTADEMPTPGTPRKLVVVGAGRGSGKTSRFLALKCVHAAWTADLSTIGPGDEPGAFIIGPKRRHAKQTFRFVLAHIKRSKILRASIAVDDRGRQLITRESITLQRPDGRRVRIEVATAAKGGEAVRGYTIVFAGMEEAAFFTADGEAVVNDREVFNAIKGRPSVAGASVWIVSTPWIASLGLMEQIIETNWGNHRNALVAARIPSRALNPNMDPDGSEERLMRSMPGGDMNADRELYAIPLPKGSRSYIDPVKLAACLALKLPAYAPKDRSAGSDLGFVKDAAAIAIVYKYDDGLYGCPAIREIAPTPGEPLIPGVVCKEFALIARSFNIARIWADRVYSESFREHLAPHFINLAFLPAGHEAKIGRFEALRDLIHQGRLALGDLPDKMRESIRTQLLSISLVPVTGGKMQLIIPRTTIDALADGTGSSSRHADAVAALVEALAGVGVDLVSPAEKVEATREAIAARPASHRQNPFGIAPHPSAMKRGPRL